MMRIGLDRHNSCFVFYSISRYRVVNGYPCRTRFRAFLSWFNRLGGTK